MYAYLRHDYRMAGYGWLNPFFTKSIGEGERDYCTRMSREFAEFLREENVELRKISENELVEVWG